MTEQAMHCAKLFMHKCISVRCFVHLLSTFMAIGLVISLSACMRKYPVSEAGIIRSFPLPTCTEKMLDSAGASLASNGTEEKKSGYLCVTGMENGELGEKSLRQKLEAPFAKADSPPVFGIALSGGGSKSSPFAVGVMAGLSDNDLLDSADYISTVSGGGYAAYFYYAHRLLPLLRGNGRVPVSSRDLYRDCVVLPTLRLATDKPISKVEKVNHCWRLGLQSIPGQVSAPEDIRYQAFLKCSQDVLRPGDCSTRTTGGLDLGLSQVSLAATVSLIPLSNIVNTLFDLGYSTAPSALTYHDGIGVSNGSTLVDQSILPLPLSSERPIRISDLCERSGAMHDCQPGMFDANPFPLSFDDLEQGLLKVRSQQGGRLPFWIINATAPRHRSAWGWLRSTSGIDTTNGDLFEMTAVSHGSARYGYVSGSVSVYDMSVLDAVAASAAFFDANQLVYRNRVGKTIAALGMHFFNMDWGYDIPNYNVSFHRRQIHRALPFPFYYLDGFLSNAGEPSQEVRDRTRSTFIRIIDGGNSENLGAYALLRRGTRNILIADASSDENGQFQALCVLRHRLLRSPGGSRYLYVPGLAAFDQCEPFTKHEGYDLHRWPVDQPALLACVRKTRSLDLRGEACHNLLPDEQRLFIVKPAMNLHVFMKQLDLVEGKNKLADCGVRGQLDGQDSPSLMNCDTALFVVANANQLNKTCPIFPQHSSVLMTANSSSTLFVAYRELARQYINEFHPLLKQFLSETEDGQRAFSAAVERQRDNAIRKGRQSCPAI